MAKADKKTKTAKTKNDLKKYKIIGEIFPVSEEGVQLETPLEIDSIQEVPAELGNSWVEAGLAEEVEETKNESKDPAPKTGAKRKSNEVTVSGPNGERRTYSLASHGPKFEVFAEAYAEKIGGEIL